MSVHRTPHTAVVGKGLFLVSLASAIGPIIGRLPQNTVAPPAPIGCYMPEVPAPDDGPAPLPGGTGFVVTVAAKTSAHPQFGLGIGVGFVVDGIQGQELFLERGTTYTFTVSGGHPFAFNPGVVGGPANAGASYPATNGITGTPTGSGTVTFTPNASYPNVMYYVCNAHANMGWRINLSDPPLRVSVKAFLEGPFNGTNAMNDGLRAAGLVPTTEPYTGLGYAHAGGGGGEVVAPAVLAIVGPNAVVDWVVLELRAAADPSTVLASRSALLQADGDVVPTSGGGAVTFSQPPGNYHVALRHRNHLGAMTLDPVALASTTVAVDLSSAATACFGTEARKDVGGVQVLWAGEVVRDRSLKYTGTDNDRDPILVTIGGSVPTNTMVGYLQDDVNMDGTVKYTGAANDRDPILVNIGGTVPTVVRDEQLP